MQPGPPFVSKVGQQSAMSLPIATGFQSWELMSNGVIQQVEFLLGLEEMSRSRRQNEISLVDRVVEFVVRSVGFTVDMSEKKKEFYCDP